MKLIIFTTTWSISKNFDSNLLKIDNIYYIGYITDKNASKHKTNEH